MQAVAVQPQQKVSNYSRQLVNPPQTAAAARKIIMGRTPLLTAEIHADIVESLKNGSTKSEAARKAGVKLSTFWEWQAANSDFSESIADAQDAWTHSLVDRGLTNLIDSDETSMISVRKAETIAKHTLDLAGRLNPDYSPKSQQKNLNVNVNVDKPVDLDMFRR